MARLRKCPVCKKPVESEHEEYKRKFYHPSCLENFIAMQRENEISKQIERAKKKLDRDNSRAISKVEEDDDRKELYLYICMKHKLKEPTGKILKQIKDYRENLNYTYKGMTLSLKYFYETMENPVKEDTIGIIPYIYEDAKADYIAKQQVEEHLNEMQTSEFVKNKTIKIKPPEKKDYSKVSIIDITSI